MSNRSDSLRAFVQWANTYIKGDEKGQAQIFLDRLFQAFGHAGSLDAGGVAECRVRKAKDDGGGTSFADYVCKPLVLIEMKKRGEKLSKHYRQAFDYWTRLVPGRPRYVVLCNFDEFEVYDFETQMDSPVGAVSLEDLPEHFGPLNFLFPGQPKPSFENDRVAVTREAADCLAQCFRRFRRRGVDQPTAQRFILQMLVALFAEDIELLPKYFVTELLKDIKSPADSYDLLGGLFEAMNTKPSPTGGRFKGVNYFNGGLFSTPARIELQDPELVLLRKASTFDWKKVQPEIFGTLFEHSLDDGSVAGTRDERRATGAHFTHPADIMKIIGPTIVDPWRKQIEAATTFTRLRELRDRLQRFIVLDPACGSGNFLYIAYRELKRLEARIYERIDAEFPKYASPDQLRLSYLIAQNFFGIDINPFAIEIAKVTMMIARKLAIDELHISERALPLDNLDANFIVADALVTTGADGTPCRTVWPPADVIIGNPPFIGAKLLKPQLGPDTVNRLRKLYPEVPGMADFCVYWIRRAHDHLPPCIAADPVAGRAGLVGTQNIRNNQSRVGGLDYVVKDGTIVEAVDNQPWSGEANVNVSIANWVKTKAPELLPALRRLWFKVESLPGPKRLHGSGPSDKHYELSFRETALINSALSDDIDVSVKSVLSCNKIPKRCFQGKIPGYDGFMVDSAAATRLRKDSAPVVVPYLTGRELLGEFTIERWAIDFRDLDMLHACAYPTAFEYCREHVLPAVKISYEQAEGTKSDMRAARREHLSRWWQFWNRRDELTATLTTLDRYIACSRVSRRPVMTFLSSEICPSDLIQVFAFDDDYSFGILQSSLHFEWFRKSSRLKVETDLRYSVRDVYETFPWPQDPTPERVERVADAARKVRELRVEAAVTVKGGLRGLYRLLELPGSNPVKDAHMALDNAVSMAYGFDIGADPLASLLALNQEIAEREVRGEPVTRPGIPPKIQDIATLKSKDCMRP